MKKKILNYLKQTRKQLDEAMDKDAEYNTSTGNGVNAFEASAMFEEVEQEVRKILDER